MAHFRVFGQGVGKHDTSGPTVAVGDRIKIDHKAEINQLPHI